MLKILYVGDPNPHSTSFHRAQAMRRLGCEVEIINPSDAYRHLKLHPKIHYLTGFRLVRGMIHKWFEQRVNGRRYDLAWVDTTYHVPRQSVELLKARCEKVVGYMIDDPTGPRDTPFWATCRHAIQAYDLCAVVRCESEQEFLHLGASRVLRIWRTFDEVEHKPFDDDEQIPGEFRSEVAFIGTWMKAGGTLGRDDFMLKLMAAGIPLSIWGNRWNRSPRWNAIKPAWRGGALGGREYVAALGGAKIGLGLLSHGNRDLHTSRSSELPFAGGLLCAERTSEHLAMFQEGVEAVFWSSVEECIQVCRDLLGDDDRRAKIRAAGMQRIRDLGFGNETVCAKILAELGHRIGGPENAPLFRLQSMATAERELEASPAYGAV